MKYHAKSTKFFQIIIKTKPETALSKNHTINAAHESKMVLSTILNPNLNYIGQNSAYPKLNTLYNSRYTLVGRRYETNNY